MTTTARKPSPAKPDKRARRAWATPKVTCLESRPEVTAYSGDTGPWL